MPRFLTDEWVAAFNVALGEADLEALTATGSVRAESGHFSVEERVSGVPDRSEAAGPLRVLLVVEDGKVSLSTADADPEAERADVVMSLAYEDAAALSRGELDPTQALGSGKVHVRGDLSVLVTGQAILASASGRMAELQQHTSY
ncbi:MAG: SCP2 sterol-binding domain-containing protein [Acidimicrobiales bacterium]